MTATRPGHREGSAAQSGDDLIAVARRVATCRYQEFVADMGTPVNITRSRPRWKLPYQLTVRIGEFAPTADEFVLEGEAFDRAYRARLEALGHDAVLRRIEEAVPDGRAVLLCYEDVWVDGGFAPGVCHRRTLAQWLSEKTGVEIPELTGPKAHGTSTQVHQTPPHVAPESPTPRWTEETFVAEMARRGHPTGDVVRRILDWAVLRADLDIAGNSTRPEPSLRLTPTSKGTTPPLVTLWMTTVEVRPLRYLSAGLDPAGLLARLHDVFGIRPSKDGRSGFVPLRALDGPELRPFLRLMNDHLGPPPTPSALPNE